MTINELKIAYKVINELMESKHMTRDNSFVRVKNYISNALCDMLTEEDYKKHD